MAAIQALSSQTREGGGGGGLGEWGFGWGARHQICSTCRAGDSSVEQVGQMLKLPNTKPISNS